MILKETMYGKEVSIENKLSKVTKTNYQRLQKASKEKQTPSILSTTTLPSLTNSIHLRSNSNTTTIIIIEIILIIHINLIHHTFQ